jgi:hypothetical protein
MEYDHRSANSPLLDEEHHCATAPLLHADDVPVNMQQTQSAEAIPIYDTHPQAYAVAIPVNSQQRSLASGSFEIIHSRISPIRSGSGEANSVDQIWTKQIFVCLFIILAIVGVVLATCDCIGPKYDDDDDD